MIRLQKWHHAMGIMRLLAIGGLLSLPIGLYSRGIASNIRAGDNGFADWLEISVSLTVMLLAPTYIGIKQLIYALQSRGRTKTLTQTAQKLKMSTGTFDVSATILLFSAEGQRVQRANSYIGKDWGFTDYIITKYQKIGGIYDKSESMSFSITFFKLPRILPNIFFDSKQSGGKEFKYLFSENQRHSLEGDFDTYFDTYFHDGYKIDSLSFITPEVLEIIKSARNFDIEIYGDTLYLYSELQAMPRQIMEMKKLGSYIREKLLHNIMTYRDDRIDYKLGRKTISIRGLELRWSLKRTRLLIACGVLLIVSSIAVGAWQLHATRLLSMDAIVIFISGMIIIIFAKKRVRILALNTRKDESVDDTPVLRGQLK
ncbi:MAG TPA: hypothetical protein PKD20_02280 [Candidatus Saccharibacteria bacterium]|nr:hypothetical protein [Candidatus Saccharibacteria bacterium]HMT55682.1 hypothetical protein [Candidatus Saccharibacteria bacterium]